MNETGANMNNQTVIVLDYSGTLSLETVLFARPHNLMEHLTASGLARVGLVDPETYWSRVVAPTWDEASTSPEGFAPHLFNQARKIAAPEISDQEIADGVDRFIRRYMENSRIDSAWNQVLWKLSSDPAVKVIIATDHYAEATGYILTYLKELNIVGGKVTEAPDDLCAASFYVSNSADVGAVKAQRAFWETVRSCLSLDRVGRLLIVDDFGLNESDADSYSDTEKVKFRKRSTMQLLEEVFHARVDAFEFVAGTIRGTAVPDYRLRREFDSLVVKASAYIEWFIQT